MMQKWKYELRYQAKETIMHTSYRPWIFCPTKEAYVYYVNGVLGGVFGLQCPGHDFSQFLGENRCDAQQIPDKEWAAKVAEYAVQGLL